MAQPHIEAGTVIEGGGVSGRQDNGAIEIFLGFFQEPERDQQIAAIVVDRRVLGEERGSGVEIFDGEFDLTGARIGDAAVVEKCGTPIIGERVVGECGGISVDGFGCLTTGEGAGRRVGKARRGTCRSLRQNRGAKD